VGELDYRGQDRVVGFFAIKVGYEATDLAKPADMNWWAETLTDSAS
jgi:hypothetical protein